MTTATGGRTAAGPATTGAGGGHPGRGRSVRVVQVYVVLLVLIPPTHVVEPLGAVGTPATVVGLLALLLWGVAVLAPGDDPCRPVVPVRLVTGLLAATFLLGYAVLHVRHVPGDELLGSDRMLLQVLSWIGVVLFTAEGLRDRADIVRVLRTLVAAVAVMAVVGLLQFRAGIDLAVLSDHIPGLHENSELVSIQDRDGFRRPAGTATHPIEFGCVIAMALPVALHLARFDRARPPLRRWLPVAAIAVGVPVAVSRSAVLAAAVAAAVVFVGLSPRARPRALGAGAAFVVAVYAMSPGLLGTIRDLFLLAGSDTSITYRTKDYDVVGAYVRQSPWLGRGPGTFLSKNYIVLDNQYLLSAVEIGLVGVLVVGLYLLAGAFLGRGARHRSADPAVRDLGQALAAASLASAAAASTFDAFSFLMFAGLVPLCLGVAGALWVGARREARAPGPAPPAGPVAPSPPHGPPPDVAASPAAGAPASPHRPFGTRRSHRVGLAIGVTLVLVPAVATVVVRWPGDGAAPAVAQAVIPPPAGPARTRGPSPEAAARALPLARAVPAPDDAPATGWVGGFVAVVRADAPPELAVPSATPPSGPAPRPAVRAVVAPRQTVPEGPTTTAAPPVVPTTTSTTSTTPTTAPDETTTTTGPDGTTTTTAAEPSP